MRNVRVGVLLSCGDLRTPTRVPIRITYDVPILVPSDLSFARSYIQQIEDSATRVFVSGTFDQNGSMTGALNVSQTTSVTRDGVRLMCRSSNASFTASLQR